MSRTEQAESGFAAFISYSHESDGVLGPMLRDGIERFARRPLRPRARRVFLDVGILSTNADLTASIERALGHSERLLLLASPQAAASPWVDKEVRWWLANHSPDTLLVAQTGGIIGWDRRAGRFDASTDALPPSLVAAVRHEPRTTDLRDLRDVPLDRANPRWQDRLADLVAAIDGVDKDTLVGENIRQTRNTRRLVRGAVSTLSVLLVLAIVATVVAFDQRNTAQAETLAATSRQLVAEASQIMDEQPDLARQLLATAYRLVPTDQVIGGLIESRSLPAVVPTQGLARAVAFSPHGDLLAIASDKQLLLEQASTATRVATMPADPGYLGAVAFSPDGRLLATGSGRGALRIIDVHNPKAPVMLGSATLTGGILNSLTFVPNTSFLAVIEDNGGALTLFDVQNPAAPVRTFGLPNAPLVSDAVVAASPDGRTLAFSGDNHTVALLDMKDPHHPVSAGTIAGHSGAITALTFSPNGSVLATGSDDYTTRLWDVSDPSQPKAYGAMSGQTGWIEALAYAPDGQTLATGAQDGTIHLWDVSDPLRPRQQSVLQGQTDFIRGLAFSPDSALLASASGDGPADSTGTHAGAVRLWPVAGALRSDAMATMPGGGLAPAFSPDNRTVAAGDPTTLWDIGDRSHPRQVSTVPTFNQSGQAVAFSPDGRTMAAGEPAVRWDVGDRSNPRSLPGAAQTSGSDTVVFNHSGSVLALSQFDNTVSLWQMSGGQPREAATLAGTKSVTGQVAFLPDDSTLAVVSNDTAELWDVTTVDSPRVVGTVRSPSSAITAVAFVPDGTLITGDRNGLVTLWNVRDATKPVVVASTSRRNTGIASIAYDPAERLLATSDAAGSVVVLDATDLTRLTQIAVLDNGGKVGPLVFSPDGRTLAGTDGGQIILWDVDIQGILSRMCFGIPPISADDWHRYLPDLSYDPPCA